MLLFPYFRSAWVYNTDEEKPISFSCFVGWYLAFLTRYDHYIHEYGSGQQGSGLNYKSLNYSIDQSATGTSYTTDGNIHAYNATYSPGSQYYDTSFYDTDRLISEPFNKTDNGITIGAGIQIRLSKRFSIPVIINYQKGFTNVKNNLSQGYDEKTGKTYYYWDYYAEPDIDNRNAPFYNSLLGFYTGLKINL